MCIRDRAWLVRAIEADETQKKRHKGEEEEIYIQRLMPVDACLLYTSDAADERSSVDLGGRRIIKKKKQNQIDRGRYNITNTTIQTSYQNIEQKQRKS